MGLLADSDNLTLYTCAKLVYACTALQGNFDLQSCASWIPNTNDLILAELLVEIRCICVSDKKYLL